MDILNFLLISFFGLIAIFLATYNADIIYKREYDFWNKKIRFLILPFFAIITLTYGLIFNYSPSHPENFYRKKNLFRDYVMGCCIYIFFGLILYYLL